MEAALEKKLRSSFPEHILLTVKEVSVLTGLSEKQLYKFRCSEDNPGPPSFKVGGLVKYRLSHVLAWIREQESSTLNGTVPEVKHPFARRTLAIQSGQLVVTK